MSADIEVLIRSNDFVAVNKPKGISVHNNEDSENLLVLLEKQLQVSKLYPVHRLDKETSGIQILGFNAETARQLSEEFQKRSVFKMYTGILRGQLKHDKGVWTWQLTDKAEGRHNPEGSAKERLECETRYQVIQKSKYFSVCEFQLITGRQHQIRKHAAIAGHHIVGDSRYGETKYNQKIAALYKTDRMFLHCAKIELLSEVIQCPVASDFLELMKETAVVIPRL